MSKCVRKECDGEDDGTGCMKCGEGSKLSAVPNYEAGRLFDEWWKSVPRAEMEQLAEDGEVHGQFDQFVAGKSTKH